MIPSGMVKRVDEDHVTVTFTTKEFCAVSGILATFGLQHPDKSIAIRGLSARETMCRQANINPVVGLEAARESLFPSLPGRLSRRRKTGGR